MTQRTILAALAGLSVAAALPAPAQVTTPGPEREPTQALAQDLRHARSLSNAFQHAARTIEPSVVHITAFDRVRLMRRGFFGQPLGEGEEQLRQLGLGSGVIVTGRGHILTNNHVIGNADELTVRLTDGREFQATVVGRDLPTDLAVLKIDATDVVPAEFADSDALQIGEWVLAVGSPFGFDSTVTAGIVSAKGRSGRQLAALSRDSYQEFIQTDAAINPGNSGGPLINLDGEVVGLNNQIATRTGGSVGIGFAIPSRLAQPVMEMLVQTGRAERSWFGVELEDLPADRAREFGLRGGVQVARVVPDSPADEAGLRAGDVIVGFAGERPATANELRNDIAFTPTGTSVQLEYLRDGRSRVGSALLIDRLSGTALALGGQAAPEIGLVARTFTMEDARRQGFDEAVGVLVLDVQSESRADRAGLRAGDIVVGVEGEYVEDVGDFLRSIDRSGRRATTLWVVRERRQGYLEIPPEI